MPEPIDADALCEGYLDATQALTGVGVPDSARYSDGRFSNGENVHAIHAFARDVIT